MEKGCWYYTLHVWHSAGTADFRVRL